VERKIEVSEQRASSRYLFEARLRVRVLKSAIPEIRGVSKNLSERGIFFVTSAALDVGTPVEVLMKMPQEIMGKATMDWHFLGEVIRVQPLDSTPRKMGVAVRFDRYEVAWRDESKKCRCESGWAAKRNLPEIERNEQEQEIEMPRRGLNR
jgi:hypothetical protein